MTRSQLWKIYSKRNPTFDGEGTVTMTAAGHERTQAILAEIRNELEKV